MKTIILNKTGNVENLEFTDIEKPVAKENEVLIKIKALSINPVDIKVRSSDQLLEMICGQERPLVLGWDLAGIVESIGSDVKTFKKGDHVFGMVNFPGRANAYAEYTTSPENHLALMPKNVSFSEAAATTLAALTALQVLQTKITKGDKILIHAGSGGVGHFAIQIAKSLGAFVITTCSDKNKDFVLSLGADQHIDYKTIKFEEVLTDIDFVLDTIGGETLLNSIKVLKKTGTVISLPSPEFLPEVTIEAEKKEVDASFFMVESNQNDINTLKKMLENEEIKPYISKTFSFDQISKAHLEIESGRTVGKIIIEL